MMSFWGGRERSVTNVNHCPASRPSFAAPSRPSFAALLRPSFTAPSRPAFTAPSRPSAHLVDARAVVQAQDVAQLLQLAGVRSARA